MSICLLVPQPVEESQIIYVYCQIPAYKQSIAAEFYSDYIQITSIVIYPSPLCITYYKSSEHLILFQSLCLEQQDSHLQQTNISTSDITVTLIN